MPFAIRPAKREDLPALVRFWIATWQLSAPQTDFEVHRNFITSELRNAIKDDRHLLVATQTDDSPCGFMLLNAAHREIEQTAVAPELLGRGVAAALMVAAKQVSPRELFLTVNKGNPRAIWFYVREGFEVVGEDVSQLSGQPVLRMRWHHDG